jgi:hypothetical protein
MIITFRISLTVINPQFGLPVGFRITDILVDLLLLLCFMFIKVDTVPVVIISVSFFKHSRFGRSTISNPIAPRSEGN